MEKKLDKTYTSKLLAEQILNTVQTIQVKRTLHEGHCCRGKDELISDILLWTSTREHSSVGQPLKTYSYFLLRTQDAT